MATGRIKRSFKSLMALGVTALAATAIALPLTTVSSNETKTTSVMAASIKHDVATDWDYSCPAGLTCAPKWTATPEISASFTYDQQIAQGSYQQIQSWKDFQYRFVAATGSQYASIVWSPDIYNNYYLPPHTSAKDAATEWSNIYAALDPKAVAAYEAAVKTPIDNLLNASITYQFSPLNIPAGQFTVNERQYDFQKWVDDYLSRATLLSRAGAAATVLADLKAGAATVTDLQPALATALTNARSELVNSLAPAFDAYKTIAAAQFADTETARKSLVNLSQQAAFDANARFLKALPAASLASLSADNQALVKRLAGYDWQAKDLSAALQDKNLKSRFDALSYTPLPATTDASVAANLFAFGNALQKLDAVVRTNTLVPADSPSAAAYGPAELAKTVNAVVSVTNAGHVANAKNPSLAELHDQQSIINGAALFEAEQADGYFASALSALLANQEVSPSFVSLVQQRVPEADRTEQLNRDLATISATGMTTELVQSVVAQAKAIYTVVDRTSFGVLVGISALFGITALMAGYAFWRGFVVKRRYGADMLEYVRSRPWVTTLAAASVVITAVAVAIVAAGVV